MKRNLFSKEYNSGRKDQLYVDYDILKKCAYDAETKGFIKMLEERLNYMISRIADENAKELMEDVQPL